MESDTNTTQMVVLDFKVVLVYNSNQKVPMK